MKGLELAEEYYKAHGKGMIRALFPEYEAGIAVGLAGQGSECFGFDDALSVDHDFGPGFCLWLTKDDYAAVGPRLRKAYDALPKSFMGFAAREESPRAGNRVGVQSIDFFYSSQIGRPDARFSLLEWLYIPEFRLATVTNGAVFHDPLGDFSRIREELLRFYPEDVRIKKIAARAVVMGQSGQYNYARCMRRGESVAAVLALSEFTRAAVSMVFLLNKRYMPFYKWMHRAMRDLPLLGHLAEPLRELALTPPAPALWDADEPRLSGGLNMRDRHVALIEEICGAIRTQLRRDGLTDSSDDFLAAHADELTARIRDPQIKSRHVTEG